ncbi:glycosyltransferase family 39 protein [Candidatus Dojkabacteria bacterium]|nr:glycosyltransferase family 39 protein [Candidatus Dojkabacteria bacterium]
MEFMKRHKETITTGLIILFGAGLRLVNISAPDFWRDEAFTLRAATMQFGDMWSSLTADTAPPLFTLILHYWLKIVPLTELSARIPSFIFGVATIYFAYLLAKQLFPYNRKYIYLTVILTALNPVLIFYSQEARAYSLLSLLATISLYLVFKITTQPKTKTFVWVLLSIITILGLYTHNLFIFIAFVNGLIIFASRANLKDLKQTAKRNIPLALAYLAVGIVFLPWFLVFLEQSKTVSQGGFWLTLDPVNDPAKLLTDTFSGEQIWMESELFRSVLKYFSDILAGLFTAGSFIIIYKQRQNDKFNQKLAALLFWIFANFLIVYLYSFKTSFIYIRYLIYLIVPALIITTIPLLNLNLNKTLKYIFTAFVIGSLSIFSVITLRNIPNSKAPMKDLIAQVEVLNSEESLILHSHAYTNHGFKIYSNLRSQIYNPQDNLPYYEGLAVLSEDDYFRQTAVAGYKQVFVIYLWDEDQDLAGELEKNYKKSDNYDYSGNLHLDIWTLK